MDHWLKDLRQRAGIKSQEELTTRLQLAGFDYKRSAIGNWEQGYPMPLKDPEFVSVLAGILKIPTSELMSIAGYTIETRQHTHISERVANIVDDLPPERQELALRLIEQLKR